MEEILEAVCIGQPWQGDTRLILFVKLRPDAALDDALAQNIRRTLREHASPRHVPDKILAVPDIPRTLSGKTAELAVKSAVEGAPVKNTRALANPEALAHFRELPELAA